MLITSEDGNNDTRVHIHGCTRKAKKKNIYKRISSCFILFFQVHMLYVANTRIYTKEFQNEMVRKAGNCIHMLVPMLKELYFLSIY
jgi:hypothetical protein